jgi:hypothetical protein
VQRRTSIDEIATTFFQHSDRFRTAAVHLSHNELDVLGIDASLVDISLLNGLEIRHVIVIVADRRGVFCDRATKSSSASAACGELLRGGHLRLGIHVLDLTDRC